MHPEIIGLYMNPVSSIEMGASLFIRIGVPSIYVHMHAVLLSADVIKSPLDSSY